MFKVLMDRFIRFVKPVSLFFHNCFTYQMVIIDSAEFEKKSILHGEDGPWID